MEEGTTQEKEGRQKTVYTWCDGTKNVEPKKKKGTLCKSGSSGGRFGKSSESRDNTLAKNFLKKSPISNP